MRDPSNLQWIHEFFLNIQLSKYECVRSIEQMGENSKGQIKPIHQDIQNHISFL